MYAFLLSNAGFLPYLLDTLHQILRVPFVRQSIILEGITKEMRGIEIAPWFNPLTPKREGFDCRVLDVFDKSTLVERAENDINIPKDAIPLIEDVDFVGSAVEIGELVPAEENGTFDYIVSSHNFEHLPDPIKFFQGVQRVLKPGGILSMAVPDMRTCFDIFRPRTTVVDWLCAFREQRSRPSAYAAAFMQNGSDVGSFSIHRSLDEVMVKGDLTAQYQKWLASGDADSYEDAHCTVMTPASFELLLLECRHLGLVSMEIENVAGPCGCEFYVRLVNSTAPQTVPDINAARTAILHRMMDEMLPAAGAPKIWTWRKRISVNYIRMLISTLAQSRQVS